MSADKENAPLQRAAKKLRTEESTRLDDAAPFPDAVTTNVVKLQTVSDLKALLEGTQMAVSDRSCDSFIVVLHDSALNQLERVIDSVHHAKAATAVPIFTVNASGDGWNKESVLKLLTAAPRVPPAKGSEEDLTPPSALPLLFLFSTFGGAAPRLVAIKEISSNMSVHSLSLLQPVFTVAHMEDRIKASLAAGNHTTCCSGPSFTLLYLGASWCPPCINILQALPRLLADGQRPKALHVCLKADMDLAQPVYDLFAVEIIPTFIILDNSKLLGVDGACCLTQPAAAADGEGQRALKEGAVVGRIQNSQEATVEAFLQKHCGTLSFTLEEDF
jgi:hypothetical protein